MFGWHWIMWLSNKVWCACINVTLVLTYSPFKNQEWINNKLQFTINPYTILGFRKQAMQQQFWQLAIAARLIKWQVFEFNNLPDSNPLSPQFILWQESSILKKLERFRVHHHDEAENFLGEEADAGGLVRIIVAIKYCWQYKKPAPVQVFPIFRSDDGSGCMNKATMNLHRQDMICTWGFKFLQTCPLECVGKNFSYPLPR